jgi:hypothetical protein
MNISSTGIKMVDDVNSVGFSFVLNLTVGGSYGTQIVYGFLSSTDYDRVVNVGTGIGSAFNTAYITSGFAWLSYEIYNPSTPGSTAGPTVVELREVNLSASGNTVPSTFAYNFVLPAGLSFRIKGYCATTLGWNSNVTLSCTSLRIGKV